jgi:hypothetical protein
LFSLDRCLVYTGLNCIDIKYIVDGTIKSVWFRQVFSLLGVWFRQVFGLLKKCTLFNADFSKTFFNNNKAILNKLLICPKPSHCVGHDTCTCRYNSFLYHLQSSRWAMVLWPKTSKTLFGPVNFSVFI